MLGSIGPWSGRAYFLDKMSLRDLVVAFFTHYSIQTYLAIAAVAAGLTVWLAQGPGGPLAAVVTVIVLYPLVEYLIHRWLLHSTMLFKSPLTAKVWKRIHYDHHQNPHDMSVLFGALYTTLPTIFIITLPLGWLVAGPAGATAALATGLLVFSGYEFCHCVQHLPFTPRNHWLRTIKKRHLAHHFHNEHGNYGITSNIWDRVFKTIYDQPRAVPRSPTAHNLGYDGAARRRFPWVGKLSASEEEFAQRRRRRAA
jgi:sterol desaturase/sphingolipid hydroxylase (fatty acid hydroxylase superfamily)